MILILNWNRPYFIRMTTATCVLCRSHHTLGNIMTNKKKQQHTHAEPSLSLSFLSSFWPILSAFSSTASFQTHSPSVLVMYSLVEICLRFRFFLFWNDTFCQLLQSSCTVEHVLSGVFVCACYFFKVLIIDGARWSDDEKKTMRDERRCQWNIVFAFINFG